MPFNNPAPDFALLSSVDATEWSGVELFDRSGGSPVSFPTFASDAGIYEDAITLLNGRGNAELNTLEGLLNNVATFGTWTATLDSASDKIVIGSDVAFTLTVNATGYNQLGFVNDATTSLTKTAPNDWGVVFILRLLLISIQSI